MPTCATSLYLLTEPQNRGQVSAEDRAKGWNNFSTLETKNAAFEEYYKASQHHDHSTVHH